MIDIVVISYNTRDMLLECLRRIRACTPQPYRLIVVDNGSADGSAAAVQGVRNEPLFLIRNLQNQGYAKACNQGIRSGFSPYIALLNADVWVTADWLPPLLACFAADPKIAVVGPKLVDGAGRITGAGIVGTLANHSPRGFLEPDEPGKYDETMDCFSVSGAAYLIRRDLLPTLGLFDERYFFYFEETDYSVNARQHGFRVVYCPDSRMIHWQGQSCRDNRVLGQRFATSRAQFVEKWSHLLTEED